jgi:NADH:ubiquinone oxidoreductase subunit F (NADH-binding)
VASEESALVAWLNGQPAKPTFPHRPFERGVADRPTLVSNAETLCHVALVARYGAEWFRSVGDPAEPGTLLLTVGVGPRATTLEVAVGLPIGAALEAVGWQRRSVGAVLVGGYFGTWLSSESAWHTPLSHSGLRSAGGLLGAGILIPVRASACVLAETAHVLRYLAGENAGQCGPCMFGLPAVARAFTALARGTLGADERSALERWLTVVPGRGACRNPDGALQLAGSALRTFPADLEDHLAGRPCAAAYLPERLLPIPRLEHSSESWR